MYNALIVDDETKSRLTLSILLSKYCPSIKVIGEASTVEEGVEKIEKQDPDLLFLDVQLSDGTGFDILSRLKTVRGKIVFTTAFNQYAIQAFKFSAFDYLLKPIDPDQLISLAERLEKASNSNEMLQQMQVLSENKNQITKIALNSTHGVYYISIHDIIRCEADSNYTNFFLKDSTKIVVAKSLKEYEEMLSGINFFRVHKSHLVNLQFVKKYDNHTGKVILHDGFQVEVARRRKDALLTLLIKIV
jgi:two-component system LytT family response regulator